ncbi:MAG TPA: hypothetical protein VFI41_00825 [Gemmatimonadales bacterium]|jgi:hypothetical protein|nr:hypothetical protein [Gemmatimonadales bacterium]
MPPEPSAEKRALLKAYEAALQQPARPANGPPPKRAVGILTVVSVLALLAIGAWLYAARPDWIFARGMPSQSPALREASLRLAMAMQYERIEQYRDSAGHLPARLSDLGAATGNLTYTTTQFGGFVLEGSDSTLQLTLRSDDSLRTFVGNSYEIVSRRGAP